MIIPKKYFPTPEHQRKKYSVDEKEFIFDTLGCLSEASENKIASRLMKKIQEDKILESDIGWLKKENFYDADGNINFSGRELAKRSGTTKEGNHGWKVANAATEGLVAESLYPWPEPGQDQRVTWDEYYSPFPDQVPKQREEFAKRFSISWGWVKKENYFEKFRQGIPLVFFVRAWIKNEGKYDGLYYRPPGTDSNHGTLGVGGKKKEGNVEYFVVFDTYEPFKKQVHPDNVDDWAIEFDIISNNNSMDIEEFKKKNVNNLIRNEDTGAYGVIYDHEGELKLFEITEERAGLAMLDREARGLIGEYEKKDVPDRQWQLLNPVKF